MVYIPVLLAGLQTCVLDKSARQEFVKFVKSVRSCSSRVRQKFVKSSQEICQKFVKSSLEAHHGSSRVCRKFIKFVRSSSHSSEAWMGVLLGSQNNIFFGMWAGKKNDSGWQLIYFMIIKLNLTNLTNFWRTLDETNEHLTNLMNLWRTWRASGLRKK